MSVVHRISFHFLRYTVKNPVIFFVFLILYGSVSILRFIYIAPGKANVYIYRVQALLHQESLQANDTNSRNARPHTPYLPENFIVRKNMTCPERFPDMYGDIAINMSEVSIRKINEQFAHTINFGGHWKPQECIPKWKVAILIPFRNRFVHLPILLRHLIPMLVAQRLSFTIFVVHQAGEEMFNRAMILNVGFTEATKMDKFDCFIFHDVDHIPENNRNYYGCTGMPRRFREKLDIYGYRLEYSTFFGGVSGVTTRQFKHVNGYSNQFWGWGGEDDDFYARIKIGGYNVSSPPFDYGRYKSIVHHHNQERQGLRRFGLLKRTKERNFIDGLSSLRYPTPEITRLPLYTNISVVLHAVEDLTLNEALAYFKAKPNGS